jgi:deoxyribonuclease V
MQKKWYISPAEAITVQNKLRHKVKITPLSMPLKKITYIAAADVSLNLFSNVVYAGIVVFSYPDLNVVKSAFAKKLTRFPYIPGLLSFREIPALLECWEKLERTIKRSSIKKTKKDIEMPQVVMVDGQGIAHPRRIGIASHFGVVAGVPTIGSAKSLLTGKFDAHKLVRQKSAPLTDKGEVIGTAFLSKQGCRPIFISPGHLISQKQSLDIIQHCMRGRRIPEPIRIVHDMVNDFRKRYNKNTNKKLYGQQSGK